MRASTTSSSTETGSGRCELAQIPLSDVEMRILLALVLAIVALSGASARLGDTEDQAINRYGVPKPVKVKRTPLIWGARELNFEYRGWKIRCALLLASNSKEYVVREEYSKIWNTEVMKAGGSPSIRDYECEAVLKAQSGEGKRWKRKTVGDLSLNPLTTFQNQFLHALSGRIWIREDGAIANLPLGSVTVRLELPRAAKYEAEMKAIEDRKARQAVPQF